MTKNRVELIADLVNLGGASCPGAVAKRLRGERAAMALREDVESLRAPGSRKKKPKPAKEIVLDDASMHALATASGLIKSVHSKLPKHLQDSNIRSDPGVEAALATGRRWREAKRTPVGGSRPARADAPVDTSLERRRAARLGRRGSEERVSSLQLPRPAPPVP
jgi:hypothetical protein